MSVMPLIFGERSPLRHSSVATGNASYDFELVPEENFVFAVAQERKRSDRTGRPFLLVLLSRQEFSETQSGMLVDKVAAALRLSMRETDIAGWYEDNTVIGVLFTELSTASDGPVQSILTKLTASLNECLDINELDEISITCHVYPGPKAKASVPEVKVFFRTGNRITSSINGAKALKRALDLVGTLMAVVLLSPLFLAIAALIKLTSKGPVLFRQTRVGQFGKTFTFLKFRSMYVNNDAAAHKDYVTRFISGGAEKQGAEGKVYKITNDPRVTPIGRFLRRTSLDELPQFLNVLRGDMSLVGPRPPLPYEFECYGVWHRRRVFEVKPGITGLWQVIGRSKTSFDDMVRLDLTYVRTWSIWLDLRILLRTPWVVLTGQGAY